MPPLSAEDELLARYPPAAGRFDEMFDSPWQPRAHWRELLAQLRGATPASMQQIVQSVQRQVRENGITYNVYADPLGSDRPWDLDVLPMILPAADWAGIEAAVIQRATLLNRILLDIYGEQRLLADGKLPAALVHGHAGFLRPCHGIAHRDGIALHLYALDLARSPDGRWWAITDRTQAPSGAGYALENRAVIARTFPDLFRDLNVQRLSGYFGTMRTSLARWGRGCVPHAGDAERPLVVLLTPGPYNETYYEQAYLARQLGFPLIHGEDLTVRDGFVWLKTLSGLQRVHVIVRRLDDDYCDPLELRADSALGVAGLTEAARRGTVLIANSLGASLLESGTLLGFLPRLCEELLGEPLRMPSVATWWCGESAALDAVLERFDQLVFKPAFPQLRTEPVFGQDLRGAPRQAFIDRLRRHPHDFIAQELVRLSQVPVWRREGVQGRSLPAGLGASAVGLRVFACASADGYVVMPGGLTRVATGPDARVVSMQRGGGSKDTWILADAPHGQHAERAATGHERLHGDSHLSSRTVENLYWFGRYAERCDNIARLMRQTFEGLIDGSADGGSGEWPALLGLCRSFELVGADLEAGDPAIEGRLLEAMRSPDLPGLTHHVQTLFRVAFNLRERLSSDNWRSLNQMVSDLTRPAPGLGIGEALALLDEAAISLMTLTGFTLDGMTRDLGWRFLSIGRRIERLHFLGTALLQALEMPAHGGLDWLLQLGDSIITYRARYLARPEWRPVLDLLIVDESNPRSVAFQLEGLVSYLRRVAAVRGECGAARLQPLLAQVRGLGREDDLRHGSARLSALLSDIRAAGSELSDRLAAQFFSYAALRETVTADA